MPFRHEDTLETHLFGQYALIDQLIDTFLDRVRARFRPRVSAEIRIEHAADAESVQFVIHGSPELLPLYLTKRGLGKLIDEMERSGHLEIRQLLTAVSDDLRAQD